MVKPHPSRLALHAVVAQKKTLLARKEALTSALRKAEDAVADAEVRSSEASGALEADRARAGREAAIAMADGGAPLPANFATHHTAIQNAKDQAQTCAATVKHLKDELADVEREIMWIPDQDAMQAAVAPFVREALDRLYGAQSSVFQCQVDLALLQDLRMISGELASEVAIARGLALSDATLGGKLRMPDAAPLQNVISRLATDPDVPFPVW